MRVFGQLEYAQLENTIPGSISGTQLGRIYLDITSTSAALPTFSDGTGRCQNLAQTAGGIITAPSRVSLPNGVRAGVTVFTTAGATYVGLITDTFIVINRASGANTAVTLPPSPTAGDICIVVDGKGDANTHNITVSAAAGNIQGSSTDVISAANGVSRYVYIGTQWNKW